MVIEKFTERVRDWVLFVTNYKRAEILVGRIFYEKGQGSATDMARRKRVRQTSEREVGMFDMVCFSRRIFHSESVYSGESGAAEDEKFKQSREEKRKLPRIPEWFERVRYTYSIKERERVRKCPL